MRILRLHLQNVHALRNEWTIHFDREPLRESGLFAITGPTGGGKSSLLDAMIVALYGRVPRYGFSSTPTELMTRHTAETLVELDFAVQQGRFRARWNVRRARGQADGRVQPARHELQNLETHTTLDLRPSEVPGYVEQLTGLNLERFLRSVILPQGDFAAFLRAKEKERGELLEELTGLHVYSDLGKLAFRSAESEENALKHLQQRLGSLPLLNEEQLQALQQQKQHLEKEIPRLHAQEQRSQHESEWLRQRRECQAACQRHQQEMESAQQAQESFRPQQHRLEQHRYLQPLRPVWQGLRRQAQQAATSAQEQRQLREQLQRGLLEVQQRQQPLQTAEGELRQRLQSQQQFAEPIRQALALESQLQMQQIRCEANQREQEQLVQAVQIAEQSCQQEEAWVQATLARQEERQRWLEVREHHLQLEELLPKLRDTWQQWQQQQQLFRQYETALDQAQAESTRDQARMQEFQRQATDQAEAAWPLDVRARELREQEQQLLGEESLGDWQAAQREAQRCARLGERLLECAQRYRDVSQQHLRHQTQIAESVNQRSQGEEVLQAQTNQLQQLLERLEAKKQLLAQNRLIEDYEAARAELKPNQPCPLCGSTEHPFVLEGERPSLTAETEQVQHLQQRCDHLKDELERARRHQTGLQARAEALQEQLAPLVQQQEDLQRRFNELTTTLPEDTELELIELDQLEQFQQHWQQQTQALEVRLQSVERLDVLRKQLQEEQAELQRQQSSLREEQAVLNERQQQRQQHIRTMQQQRDSVHQELSRYEQIWEQQAQTFGLLDEVNQTPQTLLTTLQEWWQLFQSQQQAADRESTELEQRQQRLKRDREHLQQQRQALEQATEATRQQALARQELQQQRQTALDHPDPKVLEQELQQAVSEAQQMRDQQQRQLEEVQQRQREAEQRMEWLTQEQERRRHEFEQAQSELLLSLQSLGYASVEEAEVHCLSDEEAETLMTQQQQLQAQLSTSRHALGNEQMRLAALEQEPQTTKTEQELQVALQQLRSEQERINQELGKVQLQLQQDDDLRRNQQELTQQIEAQQREFQRWGLLSELIGSADGTKFSRFAQSLTLAHLVNLANRHLSRLSDRYLLLKREGPCVEMDIVDRYQADAVRSLDSLSGGETFLVSLALALGLSDLARRNHPIDSLFIDEGFGTLDADTLDTALAALETLQAGGKTIGIISHVDALKERLTTQIQVRKNDNGNSTLRVIPEPAV